MSQKRNNVARLCFLRTFAMIHEFCANDRPDSVSQQKQTLSLVLLVAAGPSLQPSLHTPKISSGSLVLFWFGKASVSLSPLLPISFLLFACCVAGHEPLRNARWFSGRVSPAPWFPAHAGNARNGSHGLQASLSDARGSHAQHVPRHARQHVPRHADGNG